MLTIIATGMISFGIGLWVTELKMIRITRECNARIEIFKDILIEKGIEKWFKDPKLVDELVDEFADRIKRI